MANPNPPTPISRSLAERLDAALRRIPARQITYEQLFILVQDCKIELNRLYTRIEELESKSVELAAEVFRLGMGGNNQGEKPIDITIPDDVDDITPPDWTGE